MHEIETLYRAAHRKATNTAGRILGDHAAGEDVAQEAFCRAWKFYPSYDPEKGEITKWFNSILFNSLRDYQQESRLGPKSLTREISSEEVMGDTLTNNPGRREVLAREIRAVPNKSHREVLELFYVLGYTSKEISQIVEHMSQTNVTTIVMRFKESLG